MKPGFGSNPKIWGVTHAIFWGWGSGSGSVIKCVSFLMFPWLFRFMNQSENLLKLNFPQVSGASSPMAFHGICRSLSAWPAFGRFRPADPSCVGTLARDRGSSWRHASVLLASTMAVFGPEKRKLQVCIPKKGEEYRNVFQPSFFQGGELVKLQGEVVKMRDYKILSTRWFWLLDSDAPKKYSVKNQTSNVLNGDIPECLKYIWHICMTHPKSYHDGGREREW